MRFLWDGLGQIVFFSATTLLVGNRKGTQPVKHYATYPSTFSSRISEGRKPMETAKLGALGKQLIKHTVIMVVGDI